MFTGIIEELGEVEAVEPLHDAMRLTVRGPLVVSDATRGDSIAVDGCCLTLTEHSATSFSADVMRETLDRTGLGSLRPGTRVNLERAVAAGQRLGGHLVQGHVDGTGVVVRRTPSEHWDVVEIAVPEGLGRYLVGKGSVAVDGVSLTVAGLDTGADGSDTFTVSLVPETLARTTLGLRAVGDRVNLEVDVLAKYVERLLPAREGER